jgi:hypothetical protein
MARGVGATHDDRDLFECCVVEGVLPKEGVEAAALALVTELDTRDVVGDGARRPRDLEHLVARHVEELGFLVDEPGDQPRAGDAVDLRPLAGDPFHPRPPYRIG